MLRYTTAGTGKRLALLLHHDDGDREYTYDRDFKISPLIEGLDVVPTLKGGVLVSIKQDWNRIFPKEQQLPFECDACKLWPISSDSI